MVKSLEFQSSIMSSILIPSVLIVILSANLLVYSLYFIKFLFGYSMFKDLDLDYLQELVNDSFSFKQLLVKLGYSLNSGSTYINLRRYLVDNNIDFSHFGERYDTHHHYKNSLEDILVVNPSCVVVNQKLIKRLVDNNLLEYKCSCCGNLGM